jgi:hypothetical protein
MSMWTGYAEPKPDLWLKPILNELQYVKTTGNLPISSPRRARQDEGEYYEEDSYDSRFVLFQGAPVGKYLSSSSWSCILGHWFAEEEEVYDQALRRFGLTDMDTIGVTRDRVIT